MKNKRRRRNQQCYHCSDCWWRTNEEEEISSATPVDSVDKQRLDDTFNTLFESGEHDRASIKTHHISFDDDSFILVKDKSREEAKRSFMICDRIGTKMKEMEIEADDRRNE